jgi:hypothetical protein
MELPTAPSAAPPVGRTGAPPDRGELRFAPSAEDVAKASM